MNLKYYLRGLGSGIIIATSVLAITFAITNRDASVIKKARELGMVFAEETKDKQSDKQTENLPDKQTEEKTTPSEEKTTTDESSTKETTTEEVTTTEEETSTVINEETTTVPSTYTITIKRGMTSESVAMIFKNFGVIENEEEFNDYLVANGYASFIKIGVFEVKKGDSYENLAKIITGNM